MHCSKKMGCLFVDRERKRSGTAVSGGGASEGVSSIVKQRIKRAATGSSAERPMLLFPEVYCCQQLPILLAMSIEEPENTEGAQHCSCMACTDWLISTDFAIAAVASETPPGCIFWVHLHRSCIPTQVQLATWYVHAVRRIKASNHTSHNQLHQYIVRPSFSSEALRSKLAVSPGRLWFPAPL